MLIIHGAKVDVNKGARVTMLLELNRFLGKSEWYQTTLLSRNKELADHFCEVTKEVAQNRVAWR